MFSFQQKREIADAVQKILRATNHPELPDGEIKFLLHVDGAESWSFADIRNNGAVTQPGLNPWNELQDPRAFTIGDHVTKLKGSEWSGLVCGFYSTKLTPSGVCVESEHHAGSVQIYPSNALSLDKRGERVK